MIIVEGPFSLSFTDCQWMTEENKSCRCCPKAVVHWLVHIFSHYFFLQNQINAAFEPSDFRRAESTFIAREKSTIMSIDGLVFLNKLNKMGIASNDWRASTTEAKPIQAHPSASVSFSNRLGPSRRLYSGVGDSVAFDTVQLSPCYLWWKWIVVVVWMCFAFVFQGENAGNGAYSPSLLFCFVFVITFLAISFLSSFE